MKYFNCLFVKSHNYTGPKPPAYKMIPEVFVTGSISMTALGHVHKITFSSKWRIGRGDLNVYSFTKTFFCVLNTKLRPSLHCSLFFGGFGFFFALWNHRLPGLCVNKNYIPGILSTSAQKHFFFLYIIWHGFMFWNSIHIVLFQV